MEARASVPLSLLPQNSHVGSHSSDLRLLGAFKKLAAATAGGLQALDRHCGFWVSARDPVPTLPASGGDGSFHITRTSFLSLECSRQEWQAIRWIQVPIHGCE